MLLKNIKNNSPINYSQIDFWRYEIGTDPIPFNSKNKMTDYKWGSLKEEHLSQHEFERLKKEGFYDNGVAVFTGKIRRGNYKGKNLICIDIDNKKGITEFLSYSGKVDTLENLAKKTIVEQHLDNKDKAHIYFITEQPIKKRSGIRVSGNKIIDEIPKIEVKSDESTVVICSPSIHAGGYPYQTIGTKIPTVLDKKNSMELENSLDQIYQKYSSTNKTNNKNSISDLFKPDFTVQEGNNRHVELMRVMISLIQRISPILPLEKIKDICHQWNEQHCKPPLDNKQFERQWKCANNYAAKNKSSSNKHYNLLSDHQFTLDENTVYKIIEYDNPYKIYYIDERFGQIFYGELNGSIISPSKSIINIVPIKLTYFSNPIFPKTEPKVHLDYKDYASKGEYFQRKIGPCNNINDILKVLENTGHILNKSKAQDAFNSITTAMKEKGLVEYVEDVTTTGYYLVKDELIKKDITQTSNEIEKEDVLKCCRLLDCLAEEGWINKNIFPTVLKWAIISPFSFVIKQLDKNNFLPWLIFYGKSKSGKSTLGEISNKIWRPKDNNDKGFSSIDTAPKLGQVLSQSTYPVLINEVGVLSTNNPFGKYNGIIEMMKNSITSITARSKFISYSAYTDIPALCPLILTSNHKIIEDSGFLRRFIAIHFPDVEEKSEEQQESFRKLDLDILNVLGDFVSQNVTIDILKQDWKVASVNLLKKFYKFAGITEDSIPKWIDLFEEQKDIEEEINEKKYFELRGILIEEITRCYNQNNRSFSSDTDSELIIDMISALNFCLKNKLLPFLHEKNSNEIIITIDIMKKINIPNIAAFKDIASIISGFEYTSARIGSVEHESSNKPMKVIKGNRENFCKFLDPQL